VACDAVHAERDQAHHRRIDLRALGLVDELHAGEHRDRGPQARAMRPQATREVVGQTDRRERGDQRGQQERPGPVAHQRIGRAEQPEIQRRFVRVKLVTAMREQPVAAVPHLLGDQHEARFVRGPRIAQADARAEHEQGDGEEPEQFAALAGVDHAAHLSRLIPC
jgi:hypothetical protein